MNWKINRRFEDRFAAICHVGDDEGDAGGGGGSPDVSGVPEISETPAGFGGASAADVDYGYGHQEPSEQHTAHVQSLMTRENDPDFRPTMEDIAAMLSYNPSLKPKAKPVEAPAPGTPAAAVVPPAQAAAPKTAPATPAQSSPLTAEALVEALKAAGVGTPAQPATTETPASQRNFYGDVAPALELAPELAAAILGTDEPEVLQRSLPAMNHMVSGIMNRIMADVTGMVMANNQKIMQQIPQIATEQTSRVNNSQKFYTKYAELNRPAFHQTVQGIANALATQRTKAGKAFDPGSEVFMAEVADATHKYIEEQLGVSARPRPKVAPAAQTKAKRGQFITPASGAPAGRQSVSGQKSADETDLRSLVI